MNCLTTTTTQCVSCKNPISYFLELGLLGEQTDYNRSSMPELFDYTLDQGFVLNNCDKCCPNCGIYILASIETFINVIQTQLGTPSERLLPYKDCCLNYIGSVETILKLVEASDIYEKYPCCDVKLGECYNEMICFQRTYEPGIGSSTSEFIDRINDKGIVEYGAILDNCTGEVTSQLCNILDYIKEIYSPALSTLNNGSSMGEIIDRFLDKGIVIQCTEGKVLVFSAEKWIEYIDSQNA